MNEFFRRFANQTSALVGSPWAFIIATLTVVAWAITGPMFSYSDTWQLVINTGTTIVTFLMVFLIQNTQNRDAKAIHLKLDELILSKSKARNSLIDLEECSDEELERLQKQFEEIRKRNLGEADRAVDEKLLEAERALEQAQSHSGDKRENHRLA